MAQSIVTVQTDGSNKILQTLDPVPAPTLANATTTTETVIAKWQLPANFLVTGLGLEVIAGFLSGGTGTIIFRLRIGAAGTTADTLAVTLTTSAAQVANARGRVHFDIYTTSTTSMTASGFAIMQNALLGQTTGAVTNVTVVPTAPIFISITAQSSIAQANVTPLANLNVDPY